MGVLSGRFKEVLMLLFIVFVHEMGHVWMARRFNWDVIKIELLPFGGAAVLEPKGIRPAREEAWIVCWGPLQHTWMMGLSYFLLHTTDVWMVQDHQLFISHNMAILLFNLIPIHPLDGGRLVHLLYSAFLPYKLAMRATRLTSLILLFIGFFVVLIFMLKLNLIMIFSFLILTLILDYRQRNYRFIRFLMAKLDDQTSTKRSNLYVEKETTLRVVSEKIRKNHLHTVVLVENHVRTTYSLAAVLDVYFQKGAHVTIDELNKR
ncbi:MULTISPECIES: M50 family metallopeptidase [Shouchella]|uniref:M50 family metallopeptidase n=2 Tax=Shouchella TaxID=2893057 RepID=A0ABY7W9D0_9BACI|nr:MULTISPECIES: M50 family metallopeptidase [Shouchella]MED4127654.1 M50 family metallopeptidase [Shouchella miscanthi]WDF04091.1 M50 family metallopeptidase [Shouchella hunanensis]